ncbi:uncharacterized protein LOC108675189 [Hyalella azteca]|uniref:Uncharacterized protein LOC108675189 n=1 Tax=Hyalella azteca TaxID=294128 RepID=A0A979FSC9_HYAAZ|nr:uncharacterized protein LOC108675189 [Hyalella azteca]
MLPRFSTNSSIFFRISPCTLCQLSQHVRLLGLHGPVDCTAPGHHHHAVGSPRLRFSDIELPDAIMTLLQQQYAQPTAIQSMGLSLALSGRDVIGVM